MEAFQQGWLSCRKCQVLCHGAGACQAGGNHDFGGSWSYVLFSSVVWDAGSGARQPDPAVPPGQGQWGWCAKCEELVYTGTSHSGTCPAGGAHSVSGYTSQYWLPTGQSNWRLCTKCQALCFGGNDSTSPCPNGGVHDHTGSDDYTMLYVP